MQKKRGRPKKAKNLRGEDKDAVVMNQAYDLATNQSNDLKPNERLTAMRTYVLMRDKIKQEEEGFIYDELAAFLDELKRDGLIQNARPSMVAANG